MQRVRLQQIPLALYVHFPWCLHKCSYCDFNSYTIAPHLKDTLIEQYCRCLMRDLAMEAAQFAGEKLVSIYFGGGTPSLIPIAHLTKLINAIRQQFLVDATTEITLEMNPGTVDAAYCQQLTAIGINRVSLGAQTFDNELLKKIGRIHQRREIEATVAALREGGITNLNLDLIFALPGESLTTALTDLAAALRLTPQHLSWYQLTLEFKKVLSELYRQLPDNDLVWEMQQQGWDYLLQNNLTQYEVSAYACDTSYRCRHNLNYWEYGDYLGIGCGAHGKITYQQHHVVRTVKIVKPAAYMTADNFIQQQEEVKAEQLPFEFMLNTLRLYQPVTENLLFARTGTTFAALDKQLTQAEELGLIERDDQQITVTTQGKNFLNDLLEIFL